MILKAGILPFQSSSRANMVCGALARMAAAIGCLFSLFALIPSNSQAAVTIAANPSGLASLTYNGAQYVGSGQWCRPTKLYTTSGSSLLTSPLPLSVHGNANMATMVRKSVWGTVTCTYSVDGDRVRVDVTIRNQSENSIGEAAVQVMNLAPGGTVRWMDGSKSNMEGPQVAFIPYNRAQAVLANEQIAQPLSILAARIPGGLGVFVDSRINRVLPALTEGPSRQAPIQRSIPSGGSDTYELSFRFADPFASPVSVLGDLFRRWAERFPPNLVWNDRRPIGQLVLANYGRSVPYNPKNPRYWRFVDPNWDLNTSHGRDLFRSRLLEFADRNVATLKAINAQGVIVWDIEGEQYRKFQYVGDPHYLPPEMEGVVDGFFKKFANAGLRCGVTLAVRELIPPQGGRQYQLTAQTGRRYLDQDQQVFDLLDRNLSYAQKRWGCTLFYVDANGSLYWPTDASVFRQLAAKHPDVLIIPEQKTLLYYASTAPYCQDDLGRETCPAPQARWVYPKSFSVTKVTGDPVQKGFSPMNMLARMREGDVPLIPSWAGLTHRVVQIPIKLMRQAGKSLVH